MIKRFRVQNYKALRDITLELTPIHVLIGPNDAGKTSILEAIAALCRSVDYPLEEAFMGDWEGLELVWKNAPDFPISFDLSVEEGELSFEYQLSCVFTPKSRNVRTQEEEFYSAEVGQFGLTAPHSASSVYRYVVSNELKNEDGWRITERVHDSLSGVHFYRWNSRVLALPVAPDPNRRFQMDASGFGLALCLDDILSHDWERFGELTARFRKIFPHIKKIRLIQEPAYRTPAEGWHSWKELPELEKAHGKGIYFEFEGGHELPAAQVSDGVLLVLAYLTILYLPPKYQPRVVLVEEPENGIHPQRLEEVLGILRELVKEQSKTQVILTTHSPYLLDSFEPEEVTLCQMNPDGAVSAHRLSESKSVEKLRKIFTLGEIWTMEGDEALAQSAG
jgi:energy-coupling factor transporter ATP-binding protein EcfA2